mgnify:CR=1 FL=1
MFGDENSNNFQSVATEIFRRNCIATLKTDQGTVVEDHADKESIMFQAFKQQLGTCSEPNMKFNISCLLRQQVDFDSLTTPFTHDEIDAVVKEMPPDRAPGPDGFNGTFFRACWSIISADLMAAFHQFYRLAGGNLDVLNLAFGGSSNNPQGGSLQW